jgi:purine-binding chemotaxis protein CheW
MFTHPASHPVADSPTTEAQPQTLKLIVFSLGSYTLALPLVFVIKVTNTPANLRQQFEGVGLFYIGQTAVRLLDICKQLLADGTDPAIDGPFLIIFQLRSGELYGITADTPPDLQELPLSEFKPVPEVHRQLPPLSLVSYIAQPASGSQILLLDLHTLRQTTILA